MSKLQHSFRVQLNKAMQEAASPLKEELAAIQTCLQKPKCEAVTGLIKMLKESQHQDAKWFIGGVLETVKDERIIRPLLRAIQAPENGRYSSRFLWPLVKYDCTKHLGFFVSFITKLEEPGEAMMVAIEIIRAMKGPFESVVARRSIRKLLAESKLPMAQEWKQQAEVFKLEAADFIMAKYFNQTRRAFWEERNGSVPISKTP